MYDDWFNTTTAFARDYGKHNPREDWATSWEYYFFDTTPGTNGPIANNVDMQTKINALDAFFDAFSS